MHDSNPMKPKRRWYQFGVRPLVTGGEVSSVLLHLGVLAGYAAVALLIATRLLERRLLR